MLRYWSFSCYIELYSLLFMRIIAESKYKGNHMICQGDWSNRLKTEGEKRSGVSAIRVSWEVPAVKQGTQKQPWPRIILQDSPLVVWDALVWEDPILQFQSMWTNRSKEHSLGTDPQPKPLKVETHNHFVFLLYCKRLTDTFLQNKNFFPHSLSIMILPVPW